MAKKTLWILLLAGLAAAYILVDVAGKSRISIQPYTVESEKLQRPVRIVLVTDLHGSQYGPDNSALLDAVTRAAPDIVLFGGDMLHREGDGDAAIRLMSALGKAFPCYYVTGNHEMSRGETADIKAALSAAGVVPLGGKRITLAANGQSFALAGVDEYYRYFTEAAQEDKRTDRALTSATLRSKLGAVAVGADDALFSVLLIHRPEHYETCFSYGFDLMLSGHTHGGQVRIPGVLNGLYAPNQGLFPSHAGGLYEEAAGKTLIVSRGLSKKPIWAARVWNPPELVVIDLVPAGSGANQ